MRKCLFSLYVERSASGIIVLYKPTFEELARGQIVNHKIRTFELLVRVRNLKIWVIVANVHRNDCKLKLVQFWQSKHNLYKTSHISRFLKWRNLLKVKTLHSRLISTSIPYRLIIVNVKVWGIVIILDLFLN